MSKFQDLGKRLIVSSIVIVVLILLITFAKTFPVEMVLIALTAGIAAIAIWEYANFVRTKNLIPFTPFLMVMGSCVVIAIALTMFFPKLEQFPLMILLLGTFFLFIYEFNKTDNAILNISSSVFGVIYVAIPLGLMLKIVYLPEKHFGLQDGRIWFAYLLIVSKITDVGAYFAGKAWGRKKLAPMISPSKTITGAIAGVTSATLTSFLFALCARKFFPQAFELSLILSLILGFFIGVVGHVGDLAESLLKRDAKLKDSNSLPGLGGMLDMLDSLLFTAPLLYLYLYLT